MPIIHVALSPRTVEQRRAFGAAITAAAEEILGAPKERVRITFVDVEPDHFFVNGALASDAAGAS